MTKVRSSLVVLRDIALGLVIALCTINMTNAIPSSQPLVRAPVNQTPPPRLIIKPHPSQTALLYAIKMFNIQVPYGVVSIKYDPELKDRGLISYYGNGHSYVTIGNEAFLSWAILGATLGHELEAHANQELQFSNILFFLGCDVCYDSFEREAYDYETANQVRFGLNEFDMHEIQYTKNALYPK